MAAPNHTFVAERSWIALWNTRSAPALTGVSSIVRKLNLNHRWLRVLAWVGIGFIAVLLVASAAAGESRRVFFFAAFGGAAVVFMLLDEHLPALFDVLFVASAILSGTGWSWDPQPWANVYNQVNHFFTSFALTLSLGYLAFESVRALLRPHPIVFTLAIASFGVAIGALKSRNRDRTHDGLCLDLAVGGASLAGHGKQSVCMRVMLAVCLLVATASSFRAAQNPASIRVEVRAGNQPVAAADVVVAGTTYRTDASGKVTIPAMPGTVEVSIVKEGFVPTTASVEIGPGATRKVIVELQAQPAIEIEEEVTVIAATRTDKRLEDQPMRVEVLSREEIEEKMLMTPGDIVMMLNEMGGMRVQATSPSLGAASVRIQGMRGRYTRVLSDGLPLFGEVGGLGLLQIPPMDLGQVEVIKGVASALYGAGAMGGIVNLLSRRPGTDRQYEFLLNRSTRGGTDAIGFLSGPLAGKWSASLLAGGHSQEPIDVNDDAWADLPGYARAVVRPRLFWDAGNGGSLFATAGVTYEERDGGTLDGRVLGGTGLPYVEALDTRRYDAGVLTQFLIAGRYVAAVRAAVVRHTHDHQFGEVLEDDQHDTAFGEVAVRGTMGRQTWVAGFAIERDAYSPRDVPRFAYTFTVPGAFAQYEVEITRALSLSASGRVDHHSEYGTFLSPRVSALLKAGRWASRASVGSGFFPATPITEETEAAGLTRLTTDWPLAAERGVSASVDLSRAVGPASYTVTLFASRIADPLHVERSPTYVLRNLPDATTNIGVELLGTFRREPFAVTATYTHVRAHERVNGVRADVPLTPRDSAGVVGMWEREDVGRVGLEWYYTGGQRLEQNPYRAASEPYVILGLLAERQFGRVRLFINGENLTGTRQTRWDPLLRPSRAADGRWTVDAWGPLEGRNVNGGLRLRF